MTIRSSIDPPGVAGTAHHKRRIDQGPTQFVQNVLRLVPRLLLSNVVDQTSGTSQTIPHIKTPDQRLRVFVSSTVKELAAERRATTKAIESMRLHPVLFESGA